MKLLYSLFILSLLTSPLASGQQITLLPGDRFGDAPFGSLRAVDNRLYVASDGLLIFDISVPLEPHELAKFEVDTKTTIGHLDVSGNLIALTDAKAVHLVDVSNSTAPVARAVVAASPAAVIADALIDNSTLYVLSSDAQGLAIYDVSDPSAPVLQGRYALSMAEDGSGWLGLMDGFIVHQHLNRQVFHSLEAGNFLEEIFDTSYSSPAMEVLPIKDDYAYFGLGNHVVVFGPNGYVGEISAGEEDIVDMVVDGDDLLVLDAGGYLFRFLINSAHGLQLTDREAFPQSGYSRLSARGEYVYLSGDINAGLRSVSGDASTTYRPAAAGGDISVDEGTVAAVIGGDLFLFHNNAPLLPYFSRSGFAYSAAAVHEGHLYLSDHKVEVLTEIGPIPAGSFRHNNAGSLPADLHFEGDSLFSLSAGRLSQFDAANASAPTLARKFNTVDFSGRSDSDGTALSVLGDSYFLGTSTGLYGMVGVSPAQVLLEEVAVSATLINGDYLYAAVPGYLRVWDISSPASPQALTAIDLSGANVVSMKLYNDELLLLATPVSGIALANVSDPASPQLVSLQAADYAYNINDMAISDKYLFVAGNGQLRRLNINEAPALNVSTYEGVEDTPLAGHIDATDPEGDGFSISLEHEVVPGLLTLDANGDFAYTAPDNFNGLAQFAVRLTDSHGGNRVRVVNIEMAPVNDTPFTNSLTFTTAEDTPLQAGLVAIDPDGDEVTFSLLDTGAGIDLDFHSDGSFLVTPRANLSGQTQFSVRLSDPAGASRDQTIYLTVVAVNDPPLVEDVQVSGAAGSLIEANMEASDVEGDRLTFSIAADPAHGSASINSNGRFSYRSNAAFSGQDSFIVRVSDSAGALSEATVTVSVSGSGEGGSSGGGGGSLGGYLLILGILAVIWRRRLTRTL